jgi:hypothetical protein
LIKKIFMQESFNCIVIWFASSESEKFQPNKSEDKPQLAPSPASRGHALETIKEELET